MMESTMAATGSTHGRELNLLAVCLHFPPSPEPQAIQIPRLLQALPHRLTVVHARNTICNPDETITLPSAQGPRTWLAVDFPPHPGRYGLGASLRVRGLPLVQQAPDPYRCWIGPALRRTLAHIQAQTRPVDAVISFAQPFSDHLLSLLLSQRLGVPFVAHYSDPWLQRPNNPQKRDPLTQAVVSRQEQRVVSAARLIIFTCKDAAPLVMGRFGPKMMRKVRVLPHCWTPEMTQKVEPQPAESGTVVLRHLGTFYSRRTPQPLFEGLELLARERPGLLKNLRVELIGQDPAQMNRRHPAPHLPAGEVIYRPYQPFARSMALMAGADGLLVVDAPLKSSPFFPSKLVDYLASSRPILAISPPGPSQRLVRRLGGWTADPTRPQEVAAALAGLLSALPTPGPWGNERVRRSYTAGRAAALLDRWLQRALGSRGN